MNLLKYFCLIKKIRIIIVFLVVFQIETLEDIISGLQE
jgi:hypothetical protein